MSPAARRIAAFAIDGLAIGLWVAAISLAAWLARWAGWAPPAAPPAALTGKLAGHAASFVGLTLPVLGYFALFEAQRGATPGKRVLGLTVAAKTGDRLPLGRAILRNALKLAPWELSHAAIWYVPGRPFVDPPGGWSVAGWTMALAAAGLWVIILVIGDGRTPYDRLAGARVK